MKQLNAVGIFFFFVEISWYMFLGFFFRWLPSNEVVQLPSNYLTDFTLVWGFTFLVKAGNNKSLVLTPLSFLLSFLLSVCLCVPLHLCKSPDLVGVTLWVCA